MTAVMSGKKERYKYKYSIQSNESDVAFILVKNI